jgi:membrane-associated protease RseP (regulator of RpoE activity)
MVGARMRGRNRSARSALPGSTVVATGRRGLGGRMLVLLGFHFGIWQHAMLHTAHRYRATTTMVQGKHDSSGLCGWMGVRVSPMTTAFAASLGMVAPYGAIFDQPEAGSPAAAAGIEQGDVLTAINGSPLMNATDFAKIVSRTAPGTTLYLNTVRNGETMLVKLIIGSAPCRASG